MNIRSGMTAGLLLAATLLGGCASMAGLETQASPTDPNRLAAGQSLANTALSSAAWPRTDWWTRFRDPQLDRLMDEALAGNPTLRVAAARARKALALAQTTQAALYPQVNGDTAITRQRFPEHGLVPPPYGGTWKTQAQLEATLSYDLDLWGGNQAAYDSALGAAKAAEIDAFAARLALSVNIAQTYVQLEQAYLQLDVANKTLADREQVHKLTLDRFNAGIDSQLAVKQTEAGLPAAREQIARLQEIIGLTRNQLAALAGQGPDRGLALARPALTAPADPAVPASLPADLLGHRPDVVAQRWRVEAARQDIDVAKAQFYPNVNLAAFIGFQSIGLSEFLKAGSRTLGAGPAITLPVFDGGRLRGHLAGKNADYDTAVETYNQTLIEALHDVVDQLTSFRSLTEQHRQQVLAQATAQDAYDLAVLRFREGVGSYLEVLAAESQLLNQQALAVDLRARDMSLSINLARALGGGLEDTAVPSAAVAKSPE